MPIIKSAKKRVRVSRRATIRNVKTKRALKSALKTFTKGPSTKAHSSVQSEIDKALKKRVIHKNKAARLKRRAAAQAKAAGLKISKTTTKTAPKTLKKTPKKK